LQIANIIIKNADLRRKFKDEIEISGYSQLGGIGLVAAQSAYLHGAQWLGELKKYISANIAYTKEFLREKLPKVHLIETQGTYLMWLDFSAYNLSQKDLDERIVSGAKLWLDGGTMFGQEGTGFQRINAACPRSTLSDALERLAAEFA